MNITDVRVKPVFVKNDKLQAYCSITIDHSFVIRDLKIIEGTNGAFVAMPSRKLANRCQKCSYKNHLRAKYCNDCGASLDMAPSPKDERGRPKLHIDIAHPITPACREIIQKRVIEAYREEMQKWQQSGQTPPPMSSLDDIDYDEDSQSL